MGVAEYQFVGEGVGYVDNVERTFLLADFGVEKYMKQNIAQFLADLGVIALDESVAKFKHLFDGVFT